MQPVLIASNKTLAALSHGNRTPRDLLQKLSTDALPFLEDNQLQSSRYCTIDFEYLLSAEHPNKDNPFLERFLGMLSAGRNLVLLEVIEANGVQEAIGRYTRLVNLLKEFGQEDQLSRTSWNLIIVVKGEVNQSDLRALEDLKNELENSDNRPLRVYVMEGKSRAAADGYFVQSCNVWVDAMPPLLIYIHEMMASKLDSGMFAWRSIVLEPTVDTGILLGTFDAWLEDSLFLTNEDENEDESNIKFEAPPFVKHNIRPKKINKACDVTSIRFTAAHKQNNHFEKKVDELLVTKSIASVRTEAANALRKEVVDNSRGADSDIRQGEETSWFQAHKTPAMMKTMESELANQNHILSQDVSAGADSWNNLLHNLKFADKHRDRAIEIAKVVDEARSHFIPWFMRIVFTLISILVVFYLVSITLNPILGSVLSGWPYWGSALAGVGGALAATFVSWHLEKRAGNNGAKKLRASILKAYKNNASQACLDYIAETYEKNQKSAWVDLLDSSTALAKRLSATIGHAIRGMGEQFWGTATDGMPEDIYQIDRDKYKKGTCLELGKLNDDEARQHARRVIQDNGDVLWSEIKSSWQSTALACDPKKRGSFPVERVCMHWGQAVQLAQAKYLRLFLEKVMLKWGEEQTGNNINIVVTELERLQGLSVSSRPFMSSLKVSSREESLQSMFVNSNKLRNKLEERFRANQRNVRFYEKDNLPYYGMFFEATSISFDQSGGDV